MPTSNREEVEQAYRAHGWTVERREGGGVTFSKPASTPIDTQASKERMSAEPIEENDEDETEKEDFSLLDPHVLSTQDANALIAENERLKQIARLKQPARLGAISGVVTP